MRALLRLALVLVISSGELRASAQLRMPRGGKQPAPVSGGVRPSPPTRVARVTPPIDHRGLTRPPLVPSRLGDCCFGCPLHVGLGWGSFGSFPLWAWSGYDDYLSPPLVALAADAPLGGVQLDIEPRRAEVYVDGARAGLVSDFSGYYRHLDVPAGPHVITIVESGYEPLILQVVVSPGATVTHRGSLTRAYGR